MSHTVRLLLFGFAWVVFVGNARMGWSQAGAALPSIEGTIQTVETKGRTTTITVADAAGQQHEFQLTPRIQLEIVATGDDDFLAAGVMVKIDAIESNNHLFGSSFAVYPQYEGRVLPAKAVKAPPKPGQSQNLHFVTGEIVSLDHAEGEKYALLQLKVNAKTQLPVYVEPRHRVRVILTDPESIEEGQAVTVTGRPAGTRLLPTQITVDTGKTLKGAEFLPMLEQK